MSEPTTVTMGGTAIAAPAAVSAEAPAPAAAPEAKPLPTNPHARRRAIIDAAKERVTAKEAEVKAAKNGAAAETPDPGAPPAADPAKPAELPPAGQLSDENMKWLRSEMMRDPAAFANLQEMLKYKSLPDAFIALKQRNGAASRKEREADRKLAEAQRLSAERDEWDKLRREKPLDFIKKAGVSIRELAELEASAEPDDKKALREMREELTELRKWRDEREQNERAQKEELTISAAVQDMGAKYAAAKELYPNLARFEAKAKKLNPDYDVGQNAWNFLVAEHKRSGIELDLAHVLSTFEEEAISFFEDDPPRVSEQKTPGPSERGNGAVKPATPATPAEASTSLSSKLTSERGGPSPPPANRKEVVARAWAAAQQARSGNK